MKIKIITGFRENQFYTIDAEEAHKAYYLFLNPEKRGVFSNGVAIVGKNIQGIEPDYHAIMGWNYTHTMDANDWAEVRQSGIDRKIKSILLKAKDVAYLSEEKPQLLSMPLSETKIDLLE